MFIAHSQGDLFFDVNGYEINYREGIVPTSPEYVSESLKAVLSHGFDGAVLSWNIMEAPLSHLKKL